MRDDTKETDVLVFSGIVCVEYDVYAQVYKGCEPTRAVSLHWPWAYTGREPVNAEQSDVIMALFHDEDARARR